MTEACGVGTQMRLDLGARNAHHALDRGQWQRIELIASAHRQRMANGERERQPDREARAVARSALHMQRTAELLDLDRDHVHADTAPGLLRQRTRRREARLEHPLPDDFTRTRLRREHPAEL